MANILEIKNRPLEHYILSIFSLIASGEKKIYLKSYGSINGKTLDIINIMSKIIVSNKLDVEIKNKVEKSEPEDYNISVLLATLKIK